MLAVVILGYEFSLASVPECILIDGESVATEAFRHWAIKRAKGVNDAEVLRVTAQLLEDDSTVDIAGVTYTYELSDVSTYNSMQ